MQKTFRFGPFSRYPALVLPGGKIKRKILMIIIYYQLTGGETGGTQMGGGSFGVFGVSAELLYGGGNPLINAL